MPSCTGREVPARAPPLASQRAGLVAALQLVQQIESNVDQLRHFQQSTVAGEGRPPKGLRAQLAALQHSIPELAPAEAPGKAAPGNGPAASSGARNGDARRSQLPTAVGRYPDPDRAVVHAAWLQVAARDRDEGYDRPAD